MENQGEQEEKMIPVLTVTKNNAILKNIFLLSNTANGSDEESLVLGRSTDCDINLSHPSISRFHLRLLSHPSSRSLSVVDLSSVHGTWVMGKKIASNVRVELNEGDTIQIGGSSRIYKLHWVPLSRVYDIDNPFVSLSDVCEQVEDKNQKGILEDENGILYGNYEVQSLDVDNYDEGLDYKVSDDKSRLVLDNEIPLTPLFSEEAKSKSSLDKLTMGVISKKFSESIATESETETETSSWSDDILPETEIKQFSDQKSSQELVDAESEQILDFVESSSLYSKVYGENPGSANFSLFSEVEKQQLDKETESQKRDIGTPLGSNSTSEKDQENRMIPCIFFEQSSQKLMHAKLEKMVDFRSIELLNEESESQKENMAIPLENKNNLEKDQETRKSPSIFSHKSSQEPVDAEWDQNLEFLESSTPLYPKDSETPGSASFNLFSEIEIEQLDNELESQQENMVTPLENNSTSDRDQIKRIGPLISSEQSSPKFVNVEQRQNLHVREISASLYPREYSEYLGSDNSNQLSGIKILSGEESESQKENMANPPQNKKGLKTEHGKGSPLVTERQISYFPDEISLKSGNQQFGVDKTKPSKTEQRNMMSPSIFSENLVTETEISYFSDEILLETAKQHFDEEKARPQFIGDMQSEQNADSLESLASQSSVEYSEHSCSPDVKLFPEVEGRQQLNKENDSREEVMGNTWSRRCQPSSVPAIQIGEYKESRKTIGTNLEMSPSDLPDVGNQEVTKSPFTGLDSTKEAFTPDKENCTSKTLASEEAFTPDKENCTSNTSLNLMRFNSSFSESMVEISKDLLTDLNGKNEQFTPDKENFTPNTLLMRSLVRTSKRKDINSSNLSISSSMELIFSPSIKENPVSILLQERKSRMSSSRNQKVNSGENKSLVERVPFQPLFECSNTHKHAEAIEVKKNIGENYKWYMVVDTTCLLNKESRKVLQLLQGLKGTQMIIPRTVIRELDSMNRQGSLFSRRTEAICALQWVEECMTNTDWWIHVQRLDEEPRPTGQTPLVISESRLCDVYRRWFSDVAVSSVLSTWGSLFDMVSPTAGEHVLECALQLKENRNDGKFVLLSDDVTLKIKAIAEGFMCETAQEFRESLVNPFSERFLWSDSSPRGLTWSCRDDIILKEQFYGHSIKFGEDAKGLKLILLT